MLKEQTNFIFFHLSDLHFIQIGDFLRLFDFFLLVFFYLL